MAIALTLTDFLTAYPEFTGLAQARFDAFLLRTELMWPLKGACDEATRLEMQKLALCHLLKLFPDPGGEASPVDNGKYVVEIESRHDKIKYLEPRELNPFDLRTTPYGEHLEQMMKWQCCGGMFVVPGL
jgi:hypothetical protein